VGGGGGVSRESTLSFHAVYPVLAQLWLASVSSTERSDILCIIAIPTRALHSVYRFAVLVGGACCGRRCRL
jgi:hypothetical protein